jgi:hypothetical protein
MPGDARRFGLLRAEFALVGKTRTTVLLGDYILDHVRPRETIYPPPRV